MKISEQEFWNLAPEEWLKPMGSVQDTAGTIFFHEGKTALILFTRIGDVTIGSYVLPMAVNKMGKVFVITEVLLPGMFSSSVGLTLKDKHAAIVQLKIPLSQTAKGYEEKTVKFLLWAKVVCKTNRIAFGESQRHPEFMFQPVTEMGNLPVQE